MHQLLIATLEGLPHVLPPMQCFSFKLYPSSKMLPTWCTHFFRIFLTKKHFKKSLVTLSHVHCGWTVYCWVLFEYCRLSQFGRIFRKLFWSRIFSRNAYICILAILATNAVKWVCQQTENIVATKSNIFRRNLIIILIKRENGKWMRKWR